MQKVSPLKLSSFVETRAGLYGLDTDGAVWVYQGQKHGWSKLNMGKMSVGQLKRKFEKQELEVDEEELP